MIKSRQGKVNIRTNAMKMKEEIEMTKKSEFTIKKREFTIKKRAFTIWYDEEHGEISEVDESTVFLSENKLFRADVLQDIQAWFAEKYDESVHEMLDSKWATQTHG